MALLKSRRYDEAELEYRAVIPLLEKTIGPEHSDTLSARGNLGIVLFYTRRFDQSEAERIYFEHRGEKTENEGRNWESTVLRDFDEFELAGLTHPEFARLRSLLKP